MRIWFGASALLLMLPAAAHDFWIEPTKFRVRSGDTVSLYLRVGQDFKGNNALYNPEQFERYVFVSAAGEQAVSGTMGDDPAGHFRIAEPGLYMVGFLSSRFDVTFDSLTEFEQYLHIEGLERNIDLAHQRGKKSGILEYYVRCAKSLVAAPQAESAPADRVLGFPLELVAESNPYRESELRLRLLYRGQPLEGALITAFNKAEPLKKYREHTDKNGRVTFKLTRPGAWLVASVHQIPLPWYARGDWESYWASLTFELPRR